GWVRRLQRDDTIQRFCRQSPEVLWAMGRAPQAAGKKHHGTGPWAGGWHFRRRCGLWRLYGPDQQVCPQRRGQTQAEHKPDKRTDQQPAARRVQSEGGHGGANQREVKRRVERVHDLLRAATTRRMPERRLLSRLAHTSAGRVIATDPAASRGRASSAPK